jgi:ArsR family transcriptional regulator
MKVKQIPQELDEMASALRCIAHPARLQMLMLLGCEKKLSVTEIQTATGLKQSMTSQHLLSMKSHGVVKAEKEANQVFYSIKNRNILKVLNCLGNCGNSQKSS